MSPRCRLGRTELYVHPIGFGANAVGGHNLYGPQDEDAGRALVRAAVETGLDFIDTAYIYGPERSEVLIGETLAQMGARDEVVLATKGAYRVTPDGVTFDNSPAFLRECVDGSLARLRTDRIDLFYIHQPDDTTPKDEAIGELVRLKQAGKIRAIGVSNFSVTQLLEADRDGHVDVYQGQYNLLTRDVESDLLPVLVERGISFVPFFPLACGMLAGRYGPNDTFDDHRANHPLFQPEVYAANLARVETLRPIAQRHGVDVAHVALAWCLTRPGIDAVIPGAKRPDQLTSNARAAGVTLTDDDLAEIETTFG